MKEEDLSQQIHNQVLKQIDMDRRASDEEIKLLIRQETAVVASQSLMTLEERENLENQVFASIRGLDILQKLVDNHDITEIMVNGTQGIFYEEKGQIHRYEKCFQTPEQVMEVVWQIVGEGNRIINQTKPILDTRLQDGSRVNIVLQGICLNGPVISIRKFPKRPLEMEDLILMEAITQEAATFLKQMVQSGYNIFVSGGTGSGKTTFLNALSAYIGEQERVITIEDSAELQIRHVDNLVRLETREANMEGENQITIRDLIRTSLRMRPDRIIVGEIRGPEAIDLLQAMNTGHDGCMSTGHSNSAKDMMSRLETCVLMGIEIPIPAIRAQIGSAIDLCVHLGRQTDGSRKVEGIYEVNLEDQVKLQLTPIYERCNKAHGKTEFIKNGELQHTEKWERYEYRIS